MNTQRLTTGELIAGGAGLVLFISLFLDWISIGSPWELFDVVDIVLAIIALVPVVIVGAGMAGRRLNLPVAPDRLVLILGIIATTIVATFLLEGDDLKFGIFLSLLASAGLVYGGTQMGAGDRPVAPTTATGPPPSAPPPAV